MKASITKCNILTYFVHLALSQSRASFYHELVKQFTSTASFPLVLMHALLITFLALNMVMTLPALG